MPLPPRPTKEAVRRELLGSDDSPTFRKIVPPLPRYPHQEDSNEPS